MMIGKGPNEAETTHTFKADIGLNRSIVAQISEQKNEPGWMTDFRLKALAIFEKMAMPLWGADLSQLNTNDLCYYLKPLDTVKKDWESVPESIKNTFLKLGIPQAEQKYLAGVGAQYESEVIYKSLKKKWVDQGVIFSDMSDALKNYPELFRKYFSTIIPPHDNKFAALNSAVWSGGSFVYIPKGVYVDQPLQAYFRINAASFGQFERTLIIADENSQVHYVEGCSAPVYRTSSLHSAVVELVGLENSTIRYTTIQNWSTNVYNLVTKRAVAYKKAHIQWIDGNFGSKVTMKYPSIILKGPYAQGTIISIALASNGQHQDTGGKVVHLAEHTRSTIISKSISKNNGRASYRGLVKVSKQAAHAHVHVQCDALLIDSLARTDTYPTVDVKNSTATVGHEASVTTLSKSQLIYLKSRGLTQQQSSQILINGFVDIFVKELPMEYAVEINRLLVMEMEGSVG